MNSQSEVTPLKSVLIKSPVDAFINDDKIDCEWKRLHYLGRPNLENATKEFQRIESILKSRNIVAHHLPPSPELSLDSIYARDATIMTNQGVILCHMGKEARQGEANAQEDIFKSLNIPILGRIESPGKVEGGDVAWLDQDTVAIARGYRTNDEGIRQFKELVKNTCKEVIVFHSPHYQGPSDVFHLMSVFSPVDHRKAVVYSPLMPVSFREELLSRKYELIEIAAEEFDSLGCNVLAMAPGDCLIAEGNPITRKKIEKAGIEVTEYTGVEISLKGCGGPTCLTRPIERYT